MCNFLLIIKSRLRFSGTILPFHPTLWCILLRFDISAWFFFCPIPASGNISHQVLLMGIPVPWILFGYNSSRILLLNTRESSSSLRTGHSVASVTRNKTCAFPTPRQRKHHFTLGIDENPGVSHVFDRLTDDRKPILLSKNVLCQPQMCSEFSILQGLKSFHSKSLSWHWFWCVS